jgi:hypothetical protein
MKEGRIDRKTTPSASGAAPDIVTQSIKRLVWIAAPIAAAAAFYLWNFADLFPLIEYRQWIDDSDLYAGLDLFYRYAILRTETGFSRTTSFAVTALFASACGQGIACHNALHIALLLGTAGLLGATLLRQSGSRHPALVAAALVFFLFSVPVLDAASWQATMLDKCAVLLVALFTWYVARPRLPILFDQLALLALTVLAVNAKEAAWSVVPSVMLLALVQRLEHAPSVLGALPPAIGPVFARFALALAYAVMHIGQVMAKLISVDVADLARVTSGSAAANFQIFAGYLLGAAGIGSAVVIAGVLATWRAPRRTQLMLSWAAISFALAFAIPLKTSAQSPFYLLVPLFHLTAALFWIATGCMDISGARARIIVAAIIVALLTARLIEFGRSEPYYLALAQLSRNFQKTLAAVSVEIARSAPAALTFDVPATQNRAYMFVGSTGLPSGSGLARYLAPPGATPNQIAALRRAIDTPGTGEGLRVRLRADMSLESLSRLP